MDQITTGYAGNGWMQHAVDQEAAYSSYYPTANAPSYEQYADLIENLVASGDIDTIIGGKQFRNFNDAIDMFDRTETSFVESLGRGDMPSNPKDMEHWWAVDDLDPLEWTATGALAQVTGTSFYFGTGASTFSSGVGDGSSGEGHFVLTNLIASTDPLYHWLRAGMIIREDNPASQEEILIIEQSSVKYGVRGAQIGGKLDIKSTSSTLIPSAATEAHAIGAKWVSDGLVVSELSNSPSAKREGWKHRGNLLQINDFATTKTFLEDLVNVMQMSANQQIERSKTREQRRLQEQWNRAALYGVKTVYDNNGEHFYRSGGIIPFIMRYATEKWGSTSGADTMSQGYYAEGATVTSLSNITYYKANGSSNFRWGTQGDTTTPAVFSQDLVDELDMYMTLNMGNSANEDKMPTTMWLPTSFYAIASQFDEGRVQTNIYRNAVSGYHSVTYITKMGHEIHFVKDDSLRGAILLGNPANGSRNALLSLGEFEVPTLNLTTQKRFVSIQGFSWKRPEYLWGYWGNLATS